MSKDIAELLAAEAEEAERHADEEDHGPSYRRKHPPRDPAQVYSLRIPVAQIEELRQLAADKGVTPSALMREWVLERMAAEKAAQLGATWRGRRSAPFHFGFRNSDWLRPLAFGFHCSSRCLIQPHRCMARYTAGTL